MNCRERSDTCERLEREKEKGKLHNYTLMSYNKIKKKSILTAV